MAKFVFRLENYLGLKEKLLEQKKIEYGNAIIVLNNEIQKKADLEMKIGKIIVEFKERLTSTVDSRDFQSYNNYLELLKKDIINQDKRIEQAKEMVEKHRLILLEASRDHKTIETLKEKDKENYIIEEKIAEAKINDEIVSYQYNNKEK